MGSYNFIIKQAAVALALAIPATMSAQYTINGRVIDSNGDTCPATVYHIYSAADQPEHPLANYVTDMDGVFSFTLDKPGEYTVTFEYLGMKDLTVPVLVTADKSAYVLGDVVMQPDETMLSEVTVSVRKRLVVSDGANLQYNVSEDPVAKSSTVLEMLRKVPMVTVDGQDNIRVNGNTDFRIYLNGRPNPMFDSEPQRVLKAMPANAIKRIEVLTEPGAKYDAEGTGGILNIVTEESASATTDGYSGSLTAGVATDRLSGSGFIRGKVRNVTASASLTYANSRPLARSGSSQTTTEYLNDDINHLLTEDGYVKRDNAYDFTQGNMALSWEPNANNLFTVNADVQHIAGEQLINSTTTMESRNGTPLWSFKTDTDGGINTTSLTANVSYQHSFNRPDHTLVGSFQYNLKHFRLKVFQDKYDYTGMDMADNTTLQDMNTNNNEYTTQIDYHNRLSDKHTVEAGAKVLLTDNRNESWLLAGADRNSLTNSKDDYVDMKQYRNIGAAYGAYTGTFGKVTAVAGLRYEYTHLGVDFYTAGREDFSSRLHDVVPNASLSYSFSPMSVLRVAYNMRISRPTIEQLNPYQLSLTQNTVRQGNPDLTSQRSNNVSLGYSSYAGNFSYSLRLEYANISDLISEYSYLKDGIIYQTSMNIGRKQETSLNAFINWNITPRMAASINGTVAYSDFDVKPMNLYNSGWRGDFNANWSYSMPWNMRVNAYGGMASNQPNLQGNYGGWHYYGLGLSQDFLKDKSLTLSAYATNVLEKHTYWSYTTKTDDIRTTGKYGRQSWSVGMSLTWNFGNLRQDVKRVNSTIDNNDSVESGNKGGGLL